MWLYNMGLYAIPYGRLIVWSPHLLLAILILIQTYFSKEDAKSLSTFLPLLSFPLLLIYITTVNSVIKTKEETWKNKLLEAPVAHLVKLPSDFLTQELKYYFVRVIEESSLQKVMLVALPEPYMHPIDSDGNVLAPTTTKPMREGTTIHFFKIKNGEIGHSQTPFLSGYFISPHLFSNVGPYHGDEGPKTGFTLMKSIQGRLDWSLRFELVDFAGPTVQLKEINAFRKPRIKISDSETRPVNLADIEKLIAAAIEISPPNNLEGE